MKARRTRRTKTGRPGLGSTATAAPPSELEIWSEAWDSDFRPPRVPPTAIAAMSVCCRALAVDFESERFPDSWPTGLRSRSDEILATEPYVVTRLAETKVDATQIVANAVETLVRSYWTRRLSGKSAWAAPSDIYDRITYWLNHFPIPTGVLVRYLAPAVRRVLPIEMGAAWYFRQIDQIRRARFHEPYLGVEDFGPIAAGSRCDSGWEGLENWVLQAYLGVGTGLRRDSKRLELLAAFACDRINALVRGDLHERARAIDFDDLCSGLRRSLYWYAAHPGSSEKERRLGQRLLQTLQNGIVPSLPPRERTRLDDGHVDLYDELLFKVREVWKHTRDLGIENERWGELERRVPLLYDYQLMCKEYRGHPKPPEVFVRIRRRFRRLRKLGDELLNQRPARVARELLKFVTDLDLEDDGIKKALVDARMEVSGRGVPRSAWPEFELLPENRVLSIPNE